MSAAHENPPPPEPADRDATRYSPTPPVDPAATRYSDTPVADPAATRYSDTPAVETTPTPSRLPRRFGGYELLEEIGHGGMGVVYKARQFAPERLVALKLIRSGQLATEEDVRLFRQEADEAARLDHPNIVPVYEVGEHHGLHFFTMRLVEGGSLNQRLDRYRNGYKAAARLLATAARAVHYAHQRQLLHRDLKPGNILLDEAGQPHVADFGLAKRLGEGGDASQSQAVGTPEYMAPEQARGEKRLTTAADVYALGGVLYVLLAGQPPFRGAAGVVMKKVLTEEPAPPSKVRPGVPRDLETICLKCLAKEPTRRYGSAEALAEDLERWLKGEPVKGRPVGRMERTWLWCRRNPATAGLLTAFVIALLLGVGVSTYFAVTSDANYRDARQREKVANDALRTVKEGKDQLDRTNTRLEETVARSLLRPVGLLENGVAVPEIEALWDLACLPREQERVRILFVEQALQRPVTSQQLLRQADMALHAAIGLDPARRRKVEETLLSRLRDPATDFDIRTSCALIGSAMDGWSPEFTTVAARIVVEAMGKTNDPRTLSSLSQALAALAARLGPDEAAAAAHIVVEAIGKTTDTVALYSLSRALAALAARMAPDEAAAAVRIVVEAMGKTNDPGTLNSVSRALAAWLGPDEAAAAARIVVEAMGKTTFPPALSSLSEALAALAARMGPDEAARQSAAAARIVVDAMAKTTDRSALSFLSQALAALAARLGPDEAATAARIVVEAIGKTTDRFARSSLSQALAALAARLGPDEAAAAARIVVEAIGKTNDLIVLSDLSRALAALAAQMGPDEAARQSAAAARIVVEAMGKTNDPGARSSLSQALAALAAQMGPDEAARQSAAAARIVVEAMGKTNDPGARSSLSQALAALAARLGPDEAAAAARIVVEAMGKTNDPATLSSLSRALAALAARLGPGEAAAARIVVEAMGKTTDPNVLSPLSEALAALAARLGPDEAVAAARIVVKAMGKTTYPGTLSDLSRALAALATRLGPDEAARQSAAAARIVVDAMAKTTDRSALSFLSQALAALAARLGPDEAATAARIVVEAMGKTTFPPALSSLSQALAALAARLGPDEIAHRSTILAGASGTVTAPQNLWAGLAELAEISLLPGRFTDQQLVDLLKMPTCRREARQVIVRQLGWQCGQTFTDEWDFVEWAQKNRPDLDLTSPPVRPDAP